MSGIYTIFPVGFSDGLEVYCDMNTGGGGWIVIQRRQDGSVDFYRDWADYRAGFGNLAGEFWLGNDKLRTLTESVSGTWQLRIDFENWQNDKAWSEFGVFRISGEDFQLQVSSYNTESTAGDSLSLNSSSYTHKGMLFSTKDKENDRSSSSNCAIKYKGACWVHGGITVVSSLP